MVKYSEIIGLPVLIANHGTKIGIINEIIFQTDKKYVEGVYISNGSKKRKYVKFADIKIAGERVLIKDNNTDSTDYYEGKKKIAVGKEIINKKIFNQEGESLGFVHDILFDIETASLEAFQITDGIVQDLIDGRKIIPVFQDLSFNEEGIFVKKESVEEIKNSDKGLKNFLTEEKEDNF